MLGLKGILAGEPGGGEGRCRRPGGEPNTGRCPIIATPPAAVLNTAAY